MQDNSKFGQSFAAGDGVYCALGACEAYVKKENKSEKEKKKRRRKKKE